MHEAIPIICSCTFRFSFIFYKWNIKAKKNKIIRSDFYVKMFLRFFKSLNVH